jgi:phospholipid/cholesterol/gamma-HCH transport system substrate-binding protein
MNTSQASNLTRFKVGIFTFVGLILIALVTVIVNDRPFWWRSCQLVKINVEDATGLKSKSPIRSLGIEIGYLRSVDLTETHVTLGICITAPVEVLPSTRAYIRGEGFLGDKFVELKPVKYVGPTSMDERTPQSETGTPAKQSSSLWDWLVPSVYAQTTINTGTQTNGTHRKGGREIPVGEESQDVQHLVNRVDDLVQQMSGLTDNLKKAINPEELRQTMKQLNQTLDNASRTLAPEGGLNQTAQRSLAKLEDAIEQMRDVMTRLNQGKGSVGMLLNDPGYADEIREAIRNINRLLNRVGNVRFVVDLGAVQIPAFSGGRAWFNLGIWPRPDRYYLLGVTADPRGRISNVTVTTTVGGLTTVNQTQTVEQTSLLFTAMLGKIFFDRVEIALGALYGDGAGSVSFYLGPNGLENIIQLRNDVYFRNAAASVDARLSLSFSPIQNFYVRAGAESLRGATPGGVGFFAGAGLSFDDEDIKLLFTLR